MSSNGDAGGTPRGERSLLNSVLAFSVPAWFTFVVNLAAAVVLTRHLQPEVYGVVNTFQASVTLLTFLVCVGLDNGFLRYFVEPPPGYDRHGLLVVCLAAPLTVLLIAAVLVLPFASAELPRALFALEDRALTALLVASVATGVVTRLVTVYYRMEGNAWLYGTFSVALQVMLKGSMLGAALVRPDYFTVTWVSVLAVAMGVAGFVAYHARALFPAGTLSRIGSLRKLWPVVVYSFYTWPVPVLLYSQVVLTQLIVRWTLGNDAVGLLTSVNVFVGVVTAFQAGFQTFWSGYMYRNYRREVHRIKRMHDYLSLFVLAAMAGFVLFRDQVFLLLGIDYHSTKPIFALLLVHPLLLILSETTAYGIGIAQKSQLMLVVTAVSVVANVALTWALAPALGLLGACVGSVVSGVVLFVGQTYLGQKYYSSIERPGRTAFTVVGLLALSIVNFAWTDGGVLRVALSAACLASIVVVYRRALSEVVGLGRDALQARG